MDKKQQRGARTAQKRDDLIRGYLRDCAIAAVEDYVRRGRRFAGDDDETVRAAWAGRFRETWHIFLADPRLRDLGAELDLRQIELPIERVTEEWSKMQRLGSFLFSAAYADPDRWWRANEAFFLDLLEYVARAGRQH